MPKRIPRAGDDVYWAHLLPLDALGGQSAGPSPERLLMHEPIPLECDLYLSFLSTFFSWIPTLHGKWSDLPTTAIALGEESSTAAGTVFMSLTQLFRLAPDDIMLPGYYDTSHSPPTYHPLYYHKADLLDRFIRLTQYINTVQHGDFVLYIALWTEW